MFSMITNLRSTCTCVPRIRNILGYNLDSSHVKEISENKNQVLKCKIAECYMCRSEEEKACVYFTKVLSN